MQRGISKDVLFLVSFLGLKGCFNIISYKIKNGDRIEVNGTIFLAELLKSGNIKLEKVGVKWSVAFFLHFVM